MNLRGAAAVVIAMAVAGVAVRMSDRGSVVRQADATVAADAERAREFWSLYRRASDARSGGRFDAAASLYQQALALRPEHEDSLYYLGNCLLERRSYAEAERVYQKLVMTNPLGSSRGYMQLASIRASFDDDAPVDLAEARRLFERAQYVDPDSGALLGLAEVALLERRLDDAQRTLASVDAENAMSIAAPYLRGYLAFQRGDMEQAWTFFGTAVARGELKKAAVTWTEEGDVKASPELRWRALARQSVFGAEWLRLRAYLAPPGPTRADMRREYERLHRRLQQRWR